MTVEKTRAELAGNLSVGDIRRLRDDFDKRHTRADGTFDWDSANAETEAGAARVIADIARIRAEGKAKKVV